MIIEIRAEALRKMKKKAKARSVNVTRMHNNPRETSAFSRIFWETEKIFGPPSERFQSGFVAVSSQRNVGGSTSGPMSAATLA